MPDLTQLRSVIWRRNDIDSLEHCVLAQRGEQFILNGHIVAALDAVPVRCSYEVVCSADWRTRAVRVELQRGGATSTLELTKTDDETWKRGSEELTQFAGVADVDISLSPSTNTLPIRRLNLKLGDSAEVNALWIRLPDLTLEPLPQQYARTGEYSYRYSSRGGSFTADLEVDELGLVERYDKFWQRVARAD